MRTNIPRPVFLAAKTHEGAVASSMTPIQALRRTVSCCLMWEDNFYESGQSIADRMMNLVPQCEPESVALLAVELRTKQNLRHAPLALVREMARHKSHKPYVADALYEVIQRADELAEFVAIYWKEGKIPLAHCVMKGLARAFTKFNPYDLVKWDGNNAAIKLRDVAFLCHVKPKDLAQGKTIAQLVNKDHYPEKTKSSGFQVKTAYGLTEYERLPTPDTWETAFSDLGKLGLSQEDLVLRKREEWLRLMQDGKLGALALLRNLRNMTEVGIPKENIALYSGVVDLTRVLPYRFIAAARVVPQYEDILEPMMLQACLSLPKLTGVTHLVIDVSDSMNSKISEKSDLTRMDAACALAILLREQCEEVKISTFSANCVNVPPRRGFALRDAVRNSQRHTSTRLAEAMTKIYAEGGFDRLIVITDEQAHSKPADPTVKLAYMINVANMKYGVGYGPWIHIDGWSEAVVDYITKYEAEFA